MRKHLLSFKIFFASLVVFTLLGNNMASAAGNPIISYVSPAPYSIGVAITTLSPTNTGGAVLAYGYATPTVFKTLPSGGVPFTVSSDAAGNIYTADESGGNLYKITPGGVITTLNTVNNPSNVAVDGLGNIFVSDFTANTVDKFNSAGALIASYTGFNQPYGIAIDASNNAYVVNRGGLNVFKIPAGSASYAIGAAYISGLTDPYGINVDENGNLYISSISGNTVVKVPAGSTTPAAFAAGFNAPRNVYVDNANNIFVADFGTNTIKMITPAGVVSTITPQLLPYPLILLLQQQQVVLHLAVAVL